ncbi:hypothetical protein EI94DRAFT_1702404 [Lactarius quietus]|nr:hypothetical protein EI94DRAFT_1702404 [Lactarius quietus]
MFIACLLADGGSYVLRAIIHASGHTIHTTFIIHAGGHTVPTTLIAHAGGHTIPATLTIVHLLRTSQEVEDSQTEEEEYSAASECVRRAWPKESDMDWGGDTPSSGRLPGVRLVKAHKSRLSTTDSNALQGFVM